MSEMPPELKQRCDDLAEKHMNEFFMKVGLPGPGSTHNQIFEAGFRACFEEMSKFWIQKALEIREVALKEAALTMVPRADVQKLIDRIELFINDVEFDETIKVKSWQFALVRNWAKNFKHYLEEFK